MQKIAFLVFNNTAGSGGGSFHSLLHHVRNLDGRIDCAVFNLGISASQTISGLPGHRYVSYVRWNFGRLFEVIRELRKFRPDVIHAYDHKALFIARLASILLDVPVIFTKCGGSNGSMVVPFANKFVLFSGENYEHFRRYGDPERCFLIPNRLARPPVDPVLPQRLIRELQLQGHKVLLRISRFNRYYDRTFNQTEALFREFHTRDPSWRLILLGTGQDRAYLEELRARFASPDIHFVTDEEFAKEASRLIPAADAVVATGRGAMEACAYGKRVFCPSSIGKLPVELNGATFEVLFHYNFSERAPVEQNSADPRGERPSTADYFDRHFALDTVRDTFLAMYAETAKAGAERSRNLRTLAYHALQFFRLR